MHARAQKRKEISMNVERIKSQVSKLKVVGGGVGLAMKHKKIAVGVVGGALVLTPVLSGSPEVFLLNMAGLVLAVLVVRRIVLAVQHRGRRARR